MLLVVLGRHRRDYGLREIPTVLASSRILAPAGCRSLEITHRSMLLGFSDDPGQRLAHLDLIADGDK